MYAVFTLFDNSDPDLQLIFFRKQLSYEGVSYINPH
jgi:hypothetical protein